MSKSFTDLYVHGAKLNTIAKSSFTKFKQNINQIFNAYRKSITGAAASEREMSDLKRSMFNEDQSPVQFEAAFDEFRSELNRSQRLRRKLLREGVTDIKAFDDAFIRGDDDDIETRGSELFEEFEGDFGIDLSEQQTILNAVREKLISEGFQ